MARLSRLVLPGHAHWVIQRGQGVQAAFTDNSDRETYLAALGTAAKDCGVEVLAWALLPTEVQLLLVPAEVPALGRLMQAVGRRYVSAYHRRHGGAGTLWDGRYRCALVEAGPSLLSLLAWLEGQSAEPGHTSASQRLSGGAGAVVLTDPPEYWRLGNTPFEREAAYRRRLAEGLPEAEVARLRQAGLGGWAIGTPAFREQIAQTTARPLQPRRPGRPRRAVA